MQKLMLQTQQRSYPIYIQQGLLHENSELKNLCLGDQVLVLSNKTISDHYYSSIQSLFKNKKVYLFLIKDGESEKNLNNFSLIIDYLIEKKFRRNDSLIALGGGVVGDLGGFVAASYQRGMNLIQLPTSLLAQVDSSVGGKTAVNHPSGKNLIGAFYQPHGVFIELDTLDTLPEREYISGLAEIVKYAILGEKAIEQLLSTQAEAILKRDKKVLQQLIYLSCAKKADIVAQDEAEKGSRALLNLGHSFAHAIEKNTFYQRYLHGEAVAIGIQMAINLALLKNMLTQTKADQYRQLLANFGLIDKTDCTQSPSELMKIMQLDKKNLTDKYRLILPTNEACVIVEEDDHQLIESAISVQLE